VLFYTCRSHPKRKIELLCFLLNRFRRYVKHDL
jgi:hypothetical protein